MVGTVPAVTIEEPEALRADKASPENVRPPEPDWNCQLWAFAELAAMKVAAITAVLNANFMFTLH
jgi:hypothetical protein